MVQDDEYIQTLTGLGLTFLQAKTYLALAKLGKADVRTISKASNVARQDIYRIMPALQNLGLIEKILTTPTIYQVNPINESLCILLQNKTQEFIELQTKIKGLLNNLQNRKDEITLQDEDHQFSIISSKILLLKKLAKGENTTQTSIDVVGKYEGIKYMLFYRFRDIKRALKRGVKIRLITERHEDDKSLQKTIQTLKINQLFEIRYLPAPIPVKTVILDRTEVNMCIAISPAKDVPSLWSNNPNFVKVMVAYFEELWNKAMGASEPLA